MSLDTENDLEQLPAAPTTVTPSPPYYELPRLFFRVLGWDDTLLCLDAHAYVEKFGSLPEGKLVVVEMQRSDGGRHLLLRRTRMASGGKPVLEPTRLDRDAEPLVVGDQLTAFGSVTPLAGKVLAVAHLRIAPDGHGAVDP